MPTPDVVVLVPGFLGFDYLGGFYYYADRVAAALRGALETSLAGPVPIVPISTLPTHSLAERQRCLLAQLRSLDLRMNIGRLHLVGHSTGGVDSQSITCADPLAAGTSWRTVDPSGLRRKLASVTTIASPHWGTCLAASDLSRFLREPFGNLSGAGIAALALASLGASLAGDPVARDLVFGATSAPLEAVKLVRHVVRNRELLEDLTPSRMLQLRERAKHELDVPVTSFAAVAATKTIDPTTGKAREPDRFFRLLAQLAADCRPASGCHPPKENLDAIRSTVADGAAIRSPGAQLPQIDFLANDGLVGVTSQVLFERQGLATLGAVVVGDHADVLGHYERRDSLRGGEPLNAGLLHSGSGFGDDQFFELYGRVARVILAAIEGTSFIQVAG